MQSHCIRGFQEETCHDETKLVYSNDWVEERDKFHALSLHFGCGRHLNTIVVPKQTLGLYYLT